MTLNIAILFLLIIAFIILLALDKFAPDALALTLMITLVLLGYLSPNEGLSGFSNEAALTILFLMILTIGLEHTGVINILGNHLKSAVGENEWKTSTIIVFLVGLFSAFISTTAVVIVFMRILIRLSKSTNITLSRVLIPLSFAGILGGSCTLLGTSTNLLVSSIAEENNINPFEVFEFTHIGLIFFLVGASFIVLVGRYLLPIRQTLSQLTETYQVQLYLTEVIIEENSPLIGKRVQDTALYKDDNIDILEIKRADSNAYFPANSETLQIGDRLLIKSDVSKLAQIRNENGLSILERISPFDDRRMNTADMALCEVIVKPNSKVVNKLLDKNFIRSEYNAIPLAIKKNKLYYADDLNELRIEAGDILLMEIGRNNFQTLYNSPEFVVLQTIDNISVSKNKALFSSLIMIMVILAAAIKIMPIVISALTGCVIMFLTGCLNIQKAYRNIEWNVYFLLASIIPLGIAMQKVGADKLIAEKFVSIIGNNAEQVLIASIFGFTALVGSIISNNATAVLMAPIGISIATNLNIDPRPILLCIMFAANMSFLSPIGYQTNTLVYSVGQYKFTDFLKVGGILTLLMWIVASLTIPYFYFN